MPSELLNLPAQIADAIVSIPKGLVPGVVKALDRLLGAGVDILVAKLEQNKSKIDSQTESYRLVEAAIASTSAFQAGADLEIVQRSLEVLVRKEYRKQVNREAVAAAMIEDVRGPSDQSTMQDLAEPLSELDEDWLNVFERFAEDASSSRLQQLWGRVLAGEIRNAGRFSTRTLRFLSEFSQADAMTFENFSKSAFGEAAPKSLVCPPDRQDIRDLIFLEASGLIQGASGLGLRRTMTFDEKGISRLHEGDLEVIFKGEPSTKLVQEIIALTPLGQELLCLVPSRDARESARSVAHAFRIPSICDAFLAVRSSNATHLQIMEVLWLSEKPNEPRVENLVNTL